MADRQETPVVHTVHGPFDRDTTPYYARHGPKGRLVCISRSQAGMAPDAVSFPGGLRQFLCGDAGVFHLIHDTQRKFLGCLVFLWIDSGVDAKQTWIARRIRECRYAKRQTGFFTHAPIQTRAAPVAEYG